MSNELPPILTPEQFEKLCREELEKRKRSKEPNKRPIERENKEKAPQTKKKSFEPLPDNVIDFFAYLKKNNP